MKSLAYLTRQHRKPSMVATYQLSDRLHEGRRVRVLAEQIPGTVSAWLSELGACSPLVDELARAVCEGDWPVAHALGERLSVDVAVAA
jgi:hypothetical protein